MAIFDASGTAVGSSTASGDAIVAMLAAAGLAGDGALAGLAGTLQLSSATFSGSSTLEWDYIQDASATASGSSAATFGANIAFSATGVFPGTSLFQYVTPLYVVGTSSMAVAVVVDVHLPPIKAITMGPKTFSWMQLLQRGDLSVFICDGKSPVRPFAISYRLIQLRLDGSRKPVGPQNRTPVPGDVGEFYATGRAGESGQPGQWLIQWTFQRTHQSEHQITEMPFQVLDAVLEGSPGDLTDRKVKFGWS